MSADALSALAVDDLGRSLLGWQLAGWQFEIPHEPLNVKFLEPGASHIQPPAFEPIPSQTPSIATEDPSGEDLQGLPSPSMPREAFAAPPAQDIETEAASAQPVTSVPQSPAAPLFSGDAGDIAGPASSGGFGALPDVGAAAPVTLTLQMAQTGGHVGTAGAVEAPEQIATSDVTDFFEFNVILQINVLLDSDVVGQLAAGSGAHACGLGFGQLALTGGNTQSNHAVIADAGDYGGFGWLGGNYYESNAIHSVNALNDADFGLNLMAGGGSGMQSIVSGGNAQTNEAAIISLTESEGMVPGHAEISPADHVTYNVVTQINVMDDSDTVVQQAVGGGYGAQAASTGGNTQSNSALIVDENNAPEQDIPGNYYEYNMIVQANLMLDADQVVQTLAADPHGQDSNLHIDDDALAYGLLGDAIA